MRLLFKQRLFSWFDSYDIYDEVGNTLFTVNGRFSWGKMLEITDATGQKLGTLQQKVFSFLPSFEMYIGENYVGCVKKEFIFFKPSFSLDCNGWRVEGNWLEWDYSIYSPEGSLIAIISKQGFNWTDTYVLDVFDPMDAPTVLMITLAIDAEKDNRN